MTTFAWPPGGGGGVSIYSTFSVFPAGTQAGQLAVAADSGNLYEWNGTSWVLLASPGGGAPAPGVSGDIIFNSGGVLGGEPNFTTDGSGHLTAASLNLLSLQVRGSGSGIISILPQAVAGTYNFNLPTTAGTVGQVLTSQGGIASAMTWTTPTTGTVTAVSVASVNGLAGTSSGGSTPALSLSTTITGILQGNGTAISAASTTGSGNVVLATSPTLVTPVLGTPSSGLLTNCTGLPLNTGTTGQLLLTNGGIYPLGSNTQVLTITGGAPVWAAPATSGTVTSVSVVSGNGLAGTVANPTTTPAISLSTTITGLLQGNGTAISAATTGNLTDVGTDGITITGGTNSVLGSGTSIAQHVADTTHNGYLSSADWNTFNSKQPAFSALTTDGIIYATSASAIASTSAGTTAYPLVSNGGGGSPATFQQLSLTAGVTGILPIANGAMPQGNSSASKNYLSTYIPSFGSGIGNPGNGDFETGTTSGWALGTIGALTNALPTGTPTFGSGASGNLSISAIGSGSQISGNYSLSYASSAATTQGNMVASSAFYIDAEDQAKVLTVKFYYKVASGASNTNFSGGASNSFAWAAYDVTNSSWLSSAGNFGLVQTTGQGYCTGTFQTNATTQQIRFCFYNANATSGAATLYIDDFYVGPQTAPSGPAMTDSTVLTTVPSSGGLGTLSSVTYAYKRLGDQLTVQFSFSPGTVTASTAFIGIPSGISIDYTKVTNQSNGGIVGSFTQADSSGTPASVGSGNKTGILFVDGSTSNQIFISISTASFVFTKQNGSAIFNSNTWMSGYFTVPIVGWSSNSVMSADSNTRVIGAQMNGVPTGTLTGSFNIAKFPTVITDKSGSYSASTGLYTIPVTGLYDISASLDVETSSAFTVNQYIIIAIYKNGSEIYRGPVFYIPTTTATASPTVNAKSLAFNAGDTAGIYVLTSASTATYTGGQNTLSNFTIGLENGPAVITATESVNMSYTDSSIGSIGSSQGVYKYTTRLYDSHNAYNTSTGLYTCPVSGKYRISAILTTAATNISTGNSFLLAIYHNGSQYVANQVYSYGGTSDWQVLVSASVPCLGGDSLAIYTSCTPSTTAYYGAAYNNLSIERVGN
jgi:hypothetical protein